MILSITLNAALDVTYELDAIRWRGVNRVRQVHHRGGGKGINVARLLKALGNDVVVSGLAGGATGATLRADLSTHGLTHEFVSIAGDSRRTVAAVAEGEATLFNEPGPRVDAEEWQRFIDKFTTLVQRAEIVVLSGSIPPGVPAEAYRFLGEVARNAGASVVVDADGHALILALAARPVVVKPNREELARATGCTDVSTAMAAMRRAGAENIVASLGDDGLAADTTDGRWRAIPPRRVPGNATGAGDAVVAAVVAGMVNNSPWPRRLAEAAALSAAAVLTPVAGSADFGVYQRLRGEVTIERFRP